MQRTRASVAVLALLALVVGVSTAAADDEPDRRTVAEAEPNQRVVGPIPPVDDAGATAVAVGTYLADVERAATAAAIVSYVAAVEAEQRAAVERETALQRLSRPVSSSAGQTSGATGECGGATNGADAFIGRESGGSASVYNSGGSGAWGCYQIMPGTWASSCSDLGTHGSADAATQAACASRLPLSAWASSGPT